MCLFFWKKNAAIRTTELGANLSIDEQIVKAKEVLAFNRYIQGKGFDIYITENNEMNVAAFIGDFAKKVHTFGKTHDVSEEGYDSKYYNQLLKIDYPFSAEEKAQFPHVIKDANNLKELYPQNVREVMGFIAHKFLNNEITLAMANVALLNISFDVDLKNDISKPRPEKFDQTRDLIPEVSDFLHRNFIPMPQVKEFMHFILSDFQDNFASFEELETKKGKMWFIGNLDSYLQKNRDDETINPYIKEYAQKLKTYLSTERLYPTEVALLIQAISKAERKNENGSEIDKPESLYLNKKNIDEVTNMLLNAAKALSR